jgi:hypothetical protein
MAGASIELDVVLGRSVVGIGFRDISIAVALPAQP